MGSASAVALSCAVGCSWAAPPETIAITTDRTPSLVAFRDGVDEAWQPATETATGFEVAVHGPYVVTVVCENSRGDVFISQAGRTLQDPRALSLPCDILQRPHEVTGTMAEDGWVQMGSSSARLLSPSFDLSVDSGTYDLVATSNDGIAVRREIAVDGDVAVAPISVAVEGTPLVDAAFSVINTERDDFFAVWVGLWNPTITRLPAQVFFGAAEAAKVAPDSVLLATDAQTASVRGYISTWTVDGFVSIVRADRRPFRVGDATRFALPEPFTGVAFRVDDGQLSVSWHTAPPFEELRALSYGDDDEQLPRHVFDASPSYLAAIGRQTLVLDTDIPGFQPAWRIDLQHEHIRALFAARGPILGDRSSYSYTEYVHPSFDTAARLGASLGPPGASHAEL